MELRDKKWEIIEPLLSELPSGKRGRPWRDNREVLDGILRILRTGATCRDLPKVYPPYQTCHRRFQQWSLDGTLEKVLRTITEILEKRRQLNMSECSIDAKFVASKKKDLCRKDEVLQRYKVGSDYEKQGRSISILISSASCHEVGLVKPALDACFVTATPTVLIGDKAYDLDSLDASLWCRGIDMVAPHKKYRKRASTQDGRRLRWYKRRFKVERFSVG